MTDDSRPSKVKGNATTTTTTTTTTLLLRWAIVEAAEPVAIVCVRVTYTAESR